MKKTILFLSLILSLAIVGCKEDKPIDPQQDAPSISLTAGKATDSEFTFTIKTDKGSEYAYLNVTADDKGEYTAENIFQNGSKGTIETETEVSVEGLNAETSYKVVAAVRNADKYSQTAILDYTTDKKGGEGDKNSMIEFVEATQNSFKFIIHGQGMIYKFTPVEKLLLENSGMDKETYLSQFGLESEGEQEIEWFDGGVWEDIRAMDVAPDREYYVFVAEWDGTGLTGEVHEIFFKTPAAEETEGSVDIEISDITSTSVKVIANPDPALTQYFVYVRDKAWADDILKNYGESMLASLIQNPSSGSKVYFGGKTEEVWGDLSPETDYYVMALGMEGEKISPVVKKEFQTKGKTMEAPEITASATPTSRAPHEMLTLNIKSDNANLLRYYYAATGDYSQAGQSDELLIEDHGTTLSEEEAEAAVSGGGIDIRIEDLWYDTEYTLIIAARNIEGSTSYKKITARTEAKAFPQRVESSLFEELKGTWTVQYDYMNYAYMDAAIEGDEVIIAGGADSGTEEYYRNHNMLVIQGFPFQEESIPYMSPSDLKAAAGDNPLWNDYPSLAMRDFGPKIFLQINQDGSVCVPTSKNVHLYNWSSDGIVNFFGCYYDPSAESAIAPVTFPVEISQDRNTITIKECVSDAEFGYFTYRPSVFMDIWGMRACATSDIVLKRK